MGAIGGTSSANMAGAAGVNKATAVEELMQRAQVNSNKIAATYNPNRPDLEVFREKQEMEAMLPELVLQLTVGCGRQSCSNRESCATANSALKAENRSKAIPQALDLLRMKKAVKCD